jgi:hypothetical protein
MCAHKIENYEAMKQDIAQVAEVCDWRVRKDNKVRFGQRVVLEKGADVDALKAKGYFVQRDEAFLPLEFKEGDGVAMPQYSDVHAGFVVKASAKKVLVQRAQAKLVNRDELQVSVGGFAAHVSGQQKHDIQPDPQGYVQEYSLRKNGYWVAKGQDAKKGKRLSFGAYEHYDFNF